MPPPPRVRGWVAYASALACPLLALLGQLALRPATYALPFILFFLAVAFVSWLGGLRPGLVAMVASVLLGNYYFIPPLHSFSSSSLGLLSTALFVAVASFLCLSNASLHEHDRERSRLLEALSAERERLKEVLMQAPALTFVVSGPEYRFELSNALFCELVGKTDLVGKPFLEALPEHAEQYLSLLDQVYRTGEAFTGREVATWVRRPDGTREERFFNFVLQPLRDARAQVVAIANFGFEVTEQVRRRRQAEALAASLQQSEEQFRGFFDLSGVAMGQADAVTGQIVRVNAALCALTGYSEAELVGRPFLELAHPEDREADQERFRSLLRGEVPLYVSEKRYVRKDGGVRWVLVTANLLRAADGRALRTAAVIQDVTERKAAEAARWEGEVLLRSVTDALPVLVAYVDRDLRYRSANRAYREWFGLDREAMMGRTMREMLGEKAFAFVRSRTELALKGELVTFETELPYRDDSRHVRASYIPHRGASGEVEGFVVLVADISEEVRQAEERARLLREAQAAVRLRDEFLSVASHELRTPVTSLTLQLQLLARSLPADSRERARLATAERQVARLRSLVESLLDVSRISAGRLELQLTEVDLGELAREALERLGSVFAQAESSVHFEVPDGPVRGWWDIQRVDQVLVNLLSNSAKYGAGKPVRVRVWRDGERALFSVRDEGIGIGPEMLPRLFGRFERGVSERNYGGLGLGLYICRQLVEAMGGHIHVRSEPGQGTTFTVELPLTRPD